MTTTLKRDRESPASTLAQDLQKLEAFLERERPRLLDEARRRRDAATEMEREHVDIRCSDPEEIERRLHEGFRVLVDRMDTETAAAAERVSAAFVEAARPRVNGRRSL